MGVKKLETNSDNALSNHTTFSQTHIDLSKHAKKDAKMQLTVLLIRGIFLFREDIVLYS